MTDRQWMMILYGFGGFLGGQVVVWAAFYLYLVLNGLT